jgi:glycosyltransferase involved in cell wall biosynthesis
MAQGHTIVVIAPSDEYTEHLKGLGYIYYDIALDNKGSSPFRDFIFFKSLLRLYRKIKPDVILHYTIKPNIYGSFAAGICGIPSINTISGLGTVFLRDGLSSRLAKYLYRLAFLFSKRVFFQNESDKALFIKQNLVHATNTVVVPGSGIDLSKYSSSEAVQGTEVIFLFVGRLLYHKGIVEYVEAAKSLRKKNYNWRFQICGAIEPEAKLGVQEHELNSWIENDSIEYLGFSNQIKEVIRKATCIVLPSYREGISRTLLESAAMSKPLIASDVPGCKEIVFNNRNGFTCRPADSADLAEKMEQMGLLSNEQRDKLGKNGRRLMEETFDERFVIKEYVDTIMNITLKN